MRNRPTVTLNLLGASIASIAGTTVTFQKAPQFKPVPFLPKDGRRQTPADREKIHAAFLKRLRKAEKANCSNYARRNESN
jgi:hypothetical protein